LSPGRNQGLDYSDLKTQQHMYRAQTVCFLLQQPVHLGLGPIGMHHWHPSILTDAHSSDPPLQSGWNQGVSIKIIVEGSNNITSTSLTCSNSHVHNLLSMPGVFRVAEMQI
jgi:hypothetical protein